jgi:hypothetical protein
MNTYDTQANVVWSVLNAMEFKDIAIMIVEMGWAYYGGTMNSVS